MTVSTWFDTLDKKSLAIVCRYQVGPLYSNEKKKKKILYHFPALIHIKVLRGHYKKFVGYP